jgi:F-type H+-transporting ATPase subunit alpha
LPVAKQVAIVFAGTHGLLDDMPVSSLAQFEVHLMGHLDTTRRDLLSAITEKKVLDDHLSAELEAAIREARQSFTVNKGAA